MFVQLVVTPVHQIFGDPGHVVSLDTMKYMKLMHFMLKCLFISYGQCFIKAVNVACGNLFSNQWVVTILETEVFKYNFLNLTQKPYSIFCWYLYSWHFLVPRARGTASGLMLITFLSFTLSWQPCTTAVPLFAGFTCWDVLGSRRPRLDRLSQDDDPRCMSSATTGLSLLHSVDRFLPESLDVWLTLPLAVPAWDWRDQSPLLSSVVDICS